MNRNQLAAHIIIGLLGSVLLVSAALTHAAWHDVTISLGATLIGVPIISGLLRYFSGDPLEDLKIEVAKFSSITALVASGERSGVRELFSQRSDISVDVFLNSIAISKTRIYLLAYAMEFVCDHPQMLRRIAERASLGCDVRILLGDPQGKFIRYRDEEEANEGSIPSRIDTSIIRARNELGVHFGSVRMFDAPLYASIYLFDNEMIVCPALYAKRGSLAPALRVASSGAMFEKYVDQFNTIWNLSGPAVERS